MLALGFPVEEIMRLQEDLHARDLDVPDPFPDTEPAQFVPAPTLYFADDATPVPE